jgi:hypothetical protein
MKKLMIASVVLALATLTTASASAAGGPLGRFIPGSGGWRSYSYQPAPVTVVQPGYRTFSYQPAATSYEPATTFGRGYGRSYQSGINKALGRVN